MSSFQVKCKVVPSAQKGMASQACPILCRLSQIRLFALTAPKHVSSPLCFLSCLHSLSTFLYELLPSMFPAAPSTGPKRFRPTRTLTHTANPHHNAGQDSHSCVSRESPELLAASEAQDNEHLVALKVGA